MNNQKYAISGRRIYILFLALPAFLVTWWLANYFYALVVGIGSAVLLYVLFVWIPAEKVQKQLRKMKFAEARKVIKDNRKLSGKINNTDLKTDLQEACELAEGLVAALEKESRHQGKVEESLVPLLVNMQKQIERWMVHESGRQPLSAKDHDQLLGILLNYDTLFLKYQKGGLRSDEFLTSLYHTETAMLELGIDINRPVQGDSQV
jgi:hypothetical protein